MPHSSDNTENFHDEVRKFEQMSAGGNIGFFDLHAFEGIIRYYVEASKFKKALQACYAAIEQYPFSIDLKVEKVKLLITTQQTEAASEAFAEIEHLQGAEPEIAILRGDILQQQGLYQEAIEIYESSLQSGLEDDMLFFALGVAYQNIGKQQKAVDCFKRCIEINPEHFSAAQELILLLEINDQLSDHLPYFEAHTNKDPYSSNAWYYLGMVHERLEQFTEAKNAYEYASFIDPEFQDAFFSLGNMLMNLEQYEAAIEAYLVAEKQLNDDVELFCCIGAAFEKLDQFEKSMSYYRKATRVDPEHEYGWFGQGMCLFAQSKHFEALHFFRKAIALDDKNEVFWLALAQSEAQVGNVISSIEAYEECCHINPSNPDLWIQWSRLYHEQGDLEKATLVILSGLDELPDNVEIMYRAAAYLLMEGKYKQAFQYLENALLLNFDKHSILFDFFPGLEANKALLGIINQYRE